METRRQGCVVARRRTVLAVAAAMLAMGGNAQAFELDTGNADLQVRWDNTVRYNIATRVESRDRKFGNSALTDEGTYSFDRGDLVANRLDLLSELDVVYKGTSGFRVSGAAWYDAAYGDHSESNPNAPFAAIPSYRDHEYSRYTKRYYAGPSGELLDAFVFANFDAASVPVRLKAGRHTVFWGESLFLGGALHSVSYAQMPLDLQKGFATPGAEAKELFRPLNQLSGQAQVTDTLSVSAQYFMEWEAYRYPEGGTYLGPVDFAFNGPDRQFISRGLGFATNGKPVEPKQAGEYGVSLRWSPEALDGTLGVYYRRYADKLPQTFLTRVGAGVTRYNLIYADDIDLFGVSLAKNIGGVSVGAELSYRRNTPLNSQVLGIATTGLPQDGETPGPRGDTFHALVNVLGLISDTPVFDAASWAAELTWAKWDKVRSGERLFYAEGFAPCTGRDKWDGCTTKDFFGLALAFTPTWYQVLPGVDLSAPLALSVGLSGNAPTVFGGNEGNGNYSVGLSADVFQKYRIDLKYIDYFGKYRHNGTALTTQNGFTTLLQDRGFVSLTLKTTF
uniref:DUF1302 family protein n=2 Tax=Aromatoleum toluolicum TaxID=90060 RepID=A0ABX1NLB7_9RHOO|nr:DUF1302 family protein [Aromatoleum toluolicum]